MAYTKNPAVGKQRLKEMQPLASGRSVSWHSSNPQRKAYKVREFLYIVLENRDVPEFQPFLRYAPHYKVSVVENTVQAEIVVDPTEQEIQLLDHTATTPGRAIAGRGTRTLVGPANSFEVIQFWHDQQPTNDMMSVENCNLSNKELEEISRFLMSQPRPWMAMMPRGTSTLVLAPDDPHVPAEAKITTRPPRTPDVLRDTAGNVLIKDPEP